jgi:rod shape-determining protein MreC
MVYKSSFGRGFNSNILNSYVLNMFVCIFFSMILLFLSLSDSSFLKSLRFNTISICKPFFIVVGKPFQYVNDTFVFFREFKNAKKVNTTLLEENRNLKKKLDKSDFLLLENQRLKNLLKIDEINYVKKITARILIDAYKDDGLLFYIDAGKEEGLKINDIVFNEYGLIGRVTELGNYSSKVLTIFNENSVIPVVSIKSNKSFFVQGHKRKLKLKHIDKKFDLKHGETVVSTDAAGYFKENIKIGRVFKTLNDVFVIPFAKRTDSIYVNVLVYNFKNEFRD